MLGQTAESERLVEEVKAQLPAQRFVLFHILVAMRQADNAVVSGQWAAGRGHANEARRLLPRDAWLFSSDLDMLDAVSALSTGDRDRAIALASAVHKQARERGQVLVELKLHSLFPAGVMSDDCSEAQRQTLMARTGMRGAARTWLENGRYRDKKPRSDIRMQSAVNTVTSLPPESDRH